MPASLHDRSLDGEDVTDLVYRRACEKDFERSYEIVVEASRDLDQKRRRGTTRGRIASRARALAFRRNVLRYDAERFWVAESDGELVGSGIATQREQVWYLAALHVIPQFQAQGVGGELPRRCRAASPEESILTVVTEAINPASNALYSKRGMFPQTPLIGLEGSAEGGSDQAELFLEPFPSGGVDSQRLSGIDGAVLGYCRLTASEMFAMAIFSV